MSALAPIPERSTATFTLACGLLAIDLSVYTGTEETRVTRHEYVDGDPARPAGRATIDKSTGELVDASRIVKLATATSGALVAVDDEQLRAGTLPSGTCEVVCFVPVAEAHGYVTEGVYQVRAKAHGKGKDKRPNTAAETALAVICAGMRERGVWALVRYSLRGPARYGLLTEHGDLLPCFTHDQVRAQRDFDMIDTVSPKEVAMACSLIDAIGVDTPVLIDDTAVAVQAVVDALAEGIAPPAVVEEAAPILDLAAMLGASIDAAKAARAAMVPA